MTIRQEVRRRARRAAVGFAFSMLAGMSMLLLVCIDLDSMNRSRDPRMGSAWEPFVFIGGVLAAGLTIGTGPVHAYRMGRGICCDSVWPVLNLGELARMKCCPYCGRSLDDELPLGSKPDKSTAKPTPWEDELA
jgi:hypothetical protein